MQALGRADFQARSVEDHLEVHHGAHTARDFPDPGSPCSLRYSSPACVLALLARQLLELSVVSGALSRSATAFEWPRHVLPIRDMRQGHLDPSGQRPFFAPGED